MFQILQIGVVALFFGYPLITTHQLTQVNAAVSASTNEASEWESSYHYAVHLTPTEKTIIPFSNELSHSNEEMDGKLNANTIVGDQQIKHIQKQPEQHMATRNIVYVALYGVGLLGLLGVLAVYALLPELRRPLNAKVLMNHAAALTAALVLLLVGHCHPQFQNHDSCAALAFSGQYFLLAAFFWLTVLCFEMYRGLGDVLPVSRLTSTSRRFMFYSLFAWCGPMVIVCITVSLYFAPELPDWVQRPKIDKNRCWFSGAPAAFAYYYGPVAFLQIVNISMFAYILMRLRTIFRETASLHHENSKCFGGALRKRKERVVLYVKLFLLMGVTWLLEVVTRAAGTCIHAEIVIDSVNVLRGVGIFIACCCKREIFSALRNRLSNNLRCCSLNSRHRESQHTVSATSTVTIISSTRKVDI